MRSLGLAGEGKWKGKRLCEQLNAPAKQEMKM